VNGTRDFQAAEAPKQRAASEHYDGRLHPRRGSRTSEAVLLARTKLTPTRTRTPTQLAETFCERHRALATSASDSVTIADPWANLDAEARSLVGTVARSTVNRGYAIASTAIPWFPRLHTADGAALVPVT
jgi:hypothetical protein